MDTSKNMCHFIIFTAMLVGLSAPSVVLSQDLKTNLKGEFRLRHVEYNMYESTLDRIDTTNMRARARVDLDLGNGRSFRLTPQATKIFGEVAPVANNDGTFSPQRTSGDVNDTHLGFYEAFATTKAGAVDLKLGRQALVYGDSVVFGSRNWTINGQAFDAAKAEIEMGSGAVDLVYAKIQNLDEALFQDDATLYLFYYKVLREDDQELDLYAVKNNLPGREETRDSFSSGVRYQLESGKWVVKTENIYQDFRETGEWAYNLNIEAQRIFGAWRLFSTYSLASKDYDQLYANRHGYNGLIDLLGRRNLQRTSLGFAYELSKRVDLKAQALNFHKPDNNQPAYGLNGVAALPGDVNEAGLGNELDVIMSYRPSKEEVWQFGYMVFEHGSYFEERAYSRFGYIEYLANF